MSPQASYKLLEINVISARDLPPVSKTLRTYVVAWLDSGHKLTTKVNHNGHTNPTWNYKLVFPLGDLDSDSAAVEFEICNAASLRDLPIGTARVTLNSFFPPLTAKQPAVRHAALQIFRPTGQVHGILNVTVQLIDDSFPETEIGSQLSVSTLNNRHEKVDGVRDGEEEDGVRDGEGDGDNRDGVRDEDLTNVHEESDKENKTEIPRAKSVRIVSEKDDASPSDTKLKNCPSFSASYVSGMHPLPSEVAADLKKGLYYFSGEEEEYGSSIFENWSVPEETKSKASKSVLWQADKVIPVAGKDQGSSAGSSNTRKSRLSKHHRRSRSGGGLLSCFGNANGVQFRIICGSNSMENKKNKKK